MSCQTTSYAVAFICLSALVAPATIAAAENVAVFTDVQAELSKRLALKPPVAKRAYIEHRRTECRPGNTAPCSLVPPTVMRIPVTGGENFANPMCYLPDCNEYTDRVPITIMEPLRAVGFEIVQVKRFESDETRFRGFPQEVFYLGMSKTNCTSGDSSMMRTMKDSVTVSSSMTTKQGISTTKGLKIDVDYKPKVGFGGGFGASVSTTVFLDRTVNSGESRTLDVTLNVNEKAKAMHRTSMYQYSYKRSAEVPFVGEIVVDGVLDANLEGKTLVSQVLPEAERVIEVSGTLYFTGWTTSEDFLFEDKLTEDECKSIRKRLGLEPTEVYTDTLQPLGSGQNDAVPIPPKVMKDFFGTSGSQKRKDTRNRLLKSFRTGTPGSTCYIAPCERPENGLREVCEYDDQGLCTICGLEEDPICDPPREVQPVNGKKQK